MKRPLARACQILSLAALIGACSTPAPSTTPDPVPGGRPGHVLGYLKADDIPNSLAFMPAPPALGSASQAADEAIYQATRALRDTPRWALAVRDANLNFPEAPGAFSCALGHSITASTTPHLNALLSRLRADVSLTTARTKDHYKRQRPYLRHGESSCTPAERHKSDSYPSSHAAIGWAWALLLAEIAPHRGEALLRRGIAFGDSRVICGVHWQSDVEAGRLVGAATIARLQANPMFRAQMAHARKEIEQAVAEGIAPTESCHREIEALAIPERVPR